MSHLPSTAEKLRFKAVLLSEQTKADPLNRRKVLQILLDLNNAIVQFKLTLPMRAVDNELRIMTTQTACVGRPDLPCIPQIIQLVTTRDVEPETIRTALGQLIKKLNELADQLEPVKA